MPTEQPSLEEIFATMPWLRTAHEQAEHQYVKADALAGKVAEPEREDHHRKLVARGIASDLARLVVGKLFLTQSLDIARPPNPRPILVLSGGTGCGKTLAAVWVLWRRGVGRFMPAVDIASLQPRKRAADRDALDELRAEPVLVIDDIGTEPIDDDWRAQLDVLIDQRASNRRLTVLTTNLAGSDFQREYGERLWSRVTGIGRYHESTDPDWRQPANRPVSWGEEVTP